MTDIAWPLIAYIADGRRITEAEAATMVDAIRAHTAEQPAPDAAPLADPVAWEGWFEGCGSINSRTVVTRSADLADKWEAQGAKVTPLFDHPAPAPAVPDDVATWRQRADGFAKSNQMLRCDLTEAEATIEAQAAELARLREVLENEAYEFSERHEVSGFYVARRIRAALTHPTGEPK